MVYALFYFMRFAEVKTNYQENITDEDSQYKKCMHFFADELYSWLLNNVLRKYYRLIGYLDVWTDRNRIYMGAQFSQQRIVFANSVPKNIYLKETNKKH